MLPRSKLSINSVSVFKFDVIPNEDSYRVSMN